MDELAPRQRRDLVLEHLVVIGDDAAFDERAPVAGDVDALDLEVLVHGQVLGADQ